MRDVEQDGEHMWLRQSVTFSVDGQERTLEIGIPLRTGATPDEIEALLAEADAGMERIGQHLEARVARLVGAGESSSPVAVTSASAPAHPAPVAEPARPAARDATLPASTPAPAAPAAPAASTPTRAVAENAIAERPAATSPAPAKAVAAVPERAPASPPAAARIAAPSDAGAPMTIPDFIAAVQAEQGLNPKQAMEKLGVKSLAGLNLREALEMLRRQAVRDGATPAPAGELAPAPKPAPAPASVPTPAAPAPAPSAATAPPRYFEEEDDAADIILSEDDDELAAEAAEYGAEQPDEDEYEELDEVPDFGSPPAEPAPAPMPATTASTPAATASPAAAAPGDDRAARILTHMRRMRGGGAVSTQQRTAYKNIVVAELGEPKAKALIASIWSITPEKLGPEQLDALNNWGKRETFAEDTELVLAEVKAERERERDATEADGASSAASERPAPAKAPSRRASRATPTGGA